MDAWPLLSRFPFRLVVRHGDDSEPSLRQVQDGRRKSLGQRSAGSRPFDAGSIEQRKTFDQRFRSVIQHVIVGQGDAVDLGGTKKVDRPGMGAKMKGFGIGPPLKPPAADYTFQIDQPSIRPKQQRQHIAPDLVRPNRLIADDILIHQPTQHDIPGQCDLHGRPIPSGGRDARALAGC